MIGAYIEKKAGTGPRLLVRKVRKQSRHDRLKQVKVFGETVEVTLVAVTVYPAKERRLRSEVSTQVKARGGTDL
jgi:hypothetical protein